MSAPVEVVEVGTAHGPARVHRHRVATPRALLALGHGAGGGITAPDLVATTEVALDLGVSVTLVEQPYRVAGRRSPPRAPTLDEAWTDVVGVERDVAAAPVLLVGGRSSGARVACCTALATGAAGVLCLAFPLIPPGRATAPSRAPELEGAGVPVLVVQGERDPYGMPDPAPGRTVVAVRGDHALRAGLPGLHDAVGAWLSARLH